ncbi:MAG: MarR family winged helix-turn-helix transcriptional regulator [Eubacteriales bacterium]|nr:MarR family winged helix-turn-helix transcriptional regulator [Eubacteriales bacterium]
MERSMEAFFKGGQLKHLLKKEYLDFCKQFQLKRVDLEILIATNNIEYDISPNDLIHYLSLNKGHLSQSLLRLKTLGYLEISRDTKDKRHHWIKLTPLGQNISSQADEKWEQLTRKITKGITEEEFACFKKVMQQISDNIEDLL